MIVVGAGGSGLAAAVAAAERGSRVLVLEKQPQPGGTTGIAVGSFTAAGTSLQRQATIHDHPREHVEDVAKFAPADLERRNNAAQREYFLTEAAATFEWLRGMGLAFVGPSPEPPNREKRMHNVVPGAKAYIARLQTRLLQHGGQIRCDADVQELLWNDGRVIGVRAAIGPTAREPLEFNAVHGVVLAAGDYASNPEMIARHKGPQFGKVEGINPNASGDGHRLAQTAGALMKNMDVTYGPELRFIASGRRPFQQLLPTSGLLARAIGWIAPWIPQRVMNAMIKRLLVTWQHPEDAIFDDGALLINCHGERFVDETVTTNREIEVANQPQKIAYLLLDGELAERYSKWPHFVSTAPDIAYAYVDDYRRLRPDVTHLATDLAGLAKRVGLDSHKLERTVNDYNDNLVAQTPDPFGRTAQTAPRPLRPPWVLLGPVKSYFTTTEGGACVDRQMRVLDNDNQPIAGLYAVGQNGLSGMILWSHGLHIAWALTSGRLAGEAVSG